jgi:hypothetical protein
VDLEDGVVSERVKGAVLVPLEHLYSRETERQRDRETESQRDRETERKRGREEEPGHTHLAGSFP